MDIRVDNLESPQVIRLLQEHLSSMALVSPPESCHALNLSGLKVPEVTFWSLWDDDQLAGFAALKHLSETHAEVKSMRTSAQYLRKGVGRTLVQHLIEHARSRGYARLSLETGSMAYFEPARQLYLSFGFEYCPPFGNYKEDPNSIYMMKVLR